MSKLTNFLGDIIRSATGGNNPKEQAGSMFNNPSQGVQDVNESMSYGDHIYTVSGYIGDKTRVTGYRGTPTAKVTFTNVPSNYEEFEAVYTGLLGKSIQGTAAMIPMALEMYARDKSEGRRSLNLVCYADTTVSNIVRILDTKLVPSQYGPVNDPYIQRYMAAALLKGATASNAYKPIEPYTVEMCASANPPQQTTYGLDTFVYILAKGWDTEQRQVEIIMSNGSNLYKVFNCPSCYTQCKNIIGQWEGLK